MLKMLFNHLGLSPFMEKASFEVALKNKKQIAEGTYAFVFEKPKDLHFNAGQHVRLTDKKGNSRFLTLANTPQEKDLVVAMRMTDSAFKKDLGKMRVGEKVLLQILMHSPHGSFVIHKDASRPVVFLVGGIGIVPAYSMIKDAIERKLPHKIFLFYSNRRPEDAPYLAELQNLSKKHQSFKLIATMTVPEKSWKGESGYIDQVMLKKYLHNLQSPIYYIAGLSDMVNAMKTLLKELEIKEANIRSEDFSNFKMGLMTMNTNQNGSKNLLLFVAIVLIILIIITAHIGVASLVSFKDLSLVAVLSILAIIFVKLSFILFLKKKKSQRMGVSI